MDSFELRSINILFNTVTREDFYHSVTKLMLVLHSTIEDYGIAF